MSKHSCVLSLGLSWIALKGHPQRSEQSPCGCSQSRKTEFWSEPAWKLTLPAVCHLGNGVLLRKETRRLWLVQLSKKEAGGGGFLPVNLLRRVGTWEDSCLWSG